MGDRDEFDRIVEGLDLDLGFLEEEPEPEDPDLDGEEERAAGVAYIASSARSPDEDEEFYRRVDFTPRPWRRNVTLAWIGILGSPTILVLCTIVGILAPRSIVAALCLVFIASAIYLISQLPDGHPDDGPDDGAIV